MAAPGPVGGMTCRATPVSIGISSSHAGATSTNAVERRLVHEIMGGRSEIQYAGAGYIVAATGADANLLRYGRYEVIEATQAHAVLTALAQAARMVREKSALLEAGERVIGPELGGLAFGKVLLLRRITAPAASSSAPASPPARVPAAPRPRTHNLLFEFRTNTGHPVEDDMGFTLIGPSGVESQGKLAAGRVDRRNVDPGNYELRYCAVKAVNWSVDGACPSDEVQLQVDTVGFPDGTSVRMSVYSRWAADDAQPVAKLSARIDGDSASASWKYEPAVGEPIYTGLRFRAEIDKKFGWSDVLAVALHDPATPRGAQERLRALGYDPGSPSDSVNSRMTDALKKYQKDHAPLVASGELDEWTALLLQDHIA
jgi:hypothetical protein